MNDTTGKIRFGTVGTGNITHKFLMAALNCEGFALAAVCSRDAQRGAALAEEYGAPRVFTSIEEMASDDSVDAVYIASPNAFHFPQAKRFLENGKHVLLEKPFTSNAAEAEELFRIADGHGVMLAEAIRSAAMPGFLAIREHMHKLGRIHGVYSAKCQYSSRYDSFREGSIANAFRPELSNGALMDIGRYAVCPVVGLFGEPERIMASAHFLHTGVDAFGTALLSYGEAEAVLMYSKVSDSELPFEIQGENGILTAEDVYEFRNARISYRDGSAEDIAPLQEELPMSYEIKEFLKCVRAGSLESEVLSRKQTLQSMRVMDEIRRQTGLSYPADRERL